MVLHPSGIKIMLSVPLLTLPLRRATLQSARVVPPRSCSGSSGPVPAGPPPSPWAIEPSWASVLQKELQQTSFAELQEFINVERSATEVLPSAERTFAAFEACPFASTRVVVLGQDPYPNRGHAHGLAFSVPPSVRPLPGSLRNIFKELHRDIGVPPSEHGCLQSWADQGVLLLNAVLTVRAGESNSHAGRGWERLTDGAIAALSAKRSGLVFMLWGAYAQRKAVLIDSSSHLILRSPHPSPLSASRGFFGSAPFSAANLYLQPNGNQPIDWASHMAAREQATAPSQPSTVRSPQSASSGAAAVPPPPITEIPSAAPAPSPQSGATPQSGGSAPHQWWKQVQAIERQRSARNAPVDFLGCHLLGERADGAAAFRFQTLLGLMLSPRTSDAAVAQAMTRLRTLACACDDDGRMSAQAVANLDEELIERAITGVTYRTQKAARIVKAARICVDEYEGDIPRDLKAVLRLPGVGPKVGHLAMQVAWGETLGIAVDTHVHRISARLGWTRGAKNAEATRKQLESWMPREQWQDLNPVLVGFGQQVCSDQPACRSCRLAAERLCPQIGVGEEWGSLS